MHVNSPTSTPLSPTFPTRVPSDALAGRVGDIARPLPAPAAPLAPPVAAHDAVTLKAPEGTDPALWSILTTEERAFFAATVTRGPLTYMKVMSPQRDAVPPMAKGGRLDVRG